MPEHLEVHAYLGVDMDQDESVIEDYPNRENWALVKSLKGALFDRGKRKPEAQ